MTWDIQDRWLWLGFGAFLFFTTKGISHALQHTIDLSDIHDSDHAKTTIETQAEDSISLASLQTLATSPNMDLANSAIHLLLVRFTSSESASESLTRDLLSPNPHSRQQARQVLTLFDQHWESLESLPLREDVASALYDKAGPATQMMCQAFFRAMRHYRTGRLTLMSGIATAVENATILTGSSYRASHAVAFGDDGIPLAFRFHPASQRVESLIDMLPSTMNNRTRAMNRSPPLSDSSQPVSLPDSQPYSEGFPDDGLPLFEQYGLSHYNSTLAPPDQTSGNRVRLHDESAEEIELRRRRREAMVLHEGGGVIGRDDIIHPRTRNS